MALTLPMLSDGCAGTDEAVHRIQAGKVFPRQASAVAAGSGWRAPPRPPDMPAGGARRDEARNVILCG
jgi:hypothetical protein